MRHYQEKQHYPFHFCNFLNPIAPRKAKTPPWSFGPSGGNRVNLVQSYRIYFVPLGTGSSVRVAFILKGYGGPEKQTESPVLNPSARMAEKIIWLPCT